jgi:uncharacterized Fe-S cluster protein YjdI
LLKILFMEQQARKWIIFNPRRKDITRKYTNGEVTVVWRPKLCIHSMICFEGLPEVFDPDRRPWIIPGNSNTKTIVEQVKACPSGALTYYLNDPETAGAGLAEEEEPTPHPETIIEILPNGPMLVRGFITLKDKEGKEVRKGPVTALCRCGATRNKPFCDGAHSRIGFKG